MRLEDLAHLLPSDTEFKLPPKALRAICITVVSRLSDDGDYYEFSPWRTKKLRHILRELRHVDPMLCDELLKQVTAKAKAWKETYEKNAAERKARPEKRRKEIVDAIIRASKEGYEQPLALVKCGEGNCPEPCVRLSLSTEPEGKILNFDSIKDALCSQHQRRDGLWIQWHELSFFHPSLSTVCIHQTGVWRSWVRKPEQWGKPVKTAKDKLGATIRPGTVVVYQRSLGKPGASLEEMAFARVVKIWKVGTIEVLQVNRVREQADGTLTLSTRLSARHADKTVVVVLPRRVQKILDGKTVRLKKVSAVVNLEIQTDLDIEAMKETAERAEALARQTERVCDEDDEIPIGDEPWFDSDVPVIEDEVGKTFGKIFGTIEDREIEEEDFPF